MDQRNEENWKSVVAYPPISINRFIKNEPGLEDHDELNSEEHQLDLEPLVAYPPIPRAVIKEEPLEEQECDGQVKLVIAYPPISRGRIKEESPSGQDEFNLEDHQLIAEEEENQNLVDESISAPNITATVDMSTADRINGTQPRKSQKRKKIIAPKADTPPRSDDQSAGLMSTFGNRTRRSLHHLKVGKTSMSKDGDEEKNFNSTAESNGFGAQKSHRKAATVSNRARSHHSKPGSASMTRDYKGETSNKKRKVTEEQQRQGTQDDKRSETSDHSSFRDVDSSSSSDETTEQRTSGCHLGDKRDTKRKFSCKICSRKFKMKNYLRRHLLTIHQVNPSQLPEFAAGHDMRLLNHPFQCDKCMKTYKHKHSLVHHVRNECRVDPAFPCSVCNFKTTSKGNLRRHLIRVHNVDRSELDNFATAAALSVRPVLPFKCEKCERTYKTKGSLGSHKKVCGRDLSFSCAQCDYRSSEKHHLRRHLTNVHGVERSQLASYGASHVVRPQFPFKCEKCGRSYKNKHHLNSHITYECGVIPSFLCDQCGYRTSQKSNLKRHISAVHGAISSSFQS